MLCCEDELKFISLKELIEYLTKLHRHRNYSFLVSFSYHFDNEIVEIHGIPFQRTALVNSTTRINHKRDKNKKSVLVKRPRLPRKKKS